MILLLSILIYLCVVLLCSRLTTVRTRTASPWWAVAFGMIGASISGVSFVSVPGMVNTIGMTYMQTCLGFIVGYFIVAFVLLPVYYRLNLTNIYTLLAERLGTSAYKTASWFFLVSKMAGAAVRFYVVCFILQRYVLSAFDIPFPLLASVLVLLIWIYTRRGGIRTLVWTDSLQTACMLIAIAIIIYKAAGVTAEAGTSIAETARAICADSRSQWFEFSDPMSKQYFWKQFLSGIFIVIVMTGLDQDMMQKNLICKSLRDAQKDMCCYGMAFVPVNLLLLCLGVLLSMLAGPAVAGMAADELMPSFVFSGELGTAAAVAATIGIVAASLSSADSALVSMTTTYYDLRNSCSDAPDYKSGEQRYGPQSAFGIAVVFAAIVIITWWVGTPSAIDTIYTLCAYTYGPLLGMFALALINPVRTRTAVLGSRQQGMLPVCGVAIGAPLFCFALQWFCQRYAGYSFGYELLMLNGLITFVALLLLSRREKEMPLQH